MEKLLALTHGIYSIVLTLLVLDLKIPEAARTIYRIGVDLSGLRQHSRSTVHLDARSDVSGTYIAIPRLTKKGKTGLVECQ